MADIDVVKKESAGGSSRTMTWLWAVIAVLAVGGLMAWLAIQSDRITTAAVVQEEGGQRAGQTAAQPGGEAETAELGTVAADPEPYVGRRVSLNDVEVAASLGQRAFWGDVPGANPFLVVFSQNVGQQPQLESGRRYNVQGVINAVTDSALNAWEQTGAIRPGARDEASFATHYLLAEQIVR